MLGIMNRVRGSIVWLVGGPLPGDILRRMHQDPSGLGTVASSLAMRAIWHGDTFWAGYLKQLESLKLGHTYFYEWIVDPAHQTSLLLTPNP